MKPLNVPVPFAKDGIGVVAQARLAHQLVRSLWLPEDLGQEERQSRVSAAMTLLEGIKPEDPIEGMLAVQMIATHEAATECLRRAMLPGQTFEGRDQALRYAAKLMGLYERQLTALDKRRGRGQQSVTVKYVHVGQGGQAIVGNVSQAAPKDAPLADDSRAIASPNEQPMEILTPTEPKSRAVLASGDANAEKAPRANKRRRGTR